MTRYAIIANFSDDSVALIQWCQQNTTLSNDQFYIVSVDTGWSSQFWQKRQEQAQQWVCQLGMHFVQLKAPHTMTTLIDNRGSFPSPNFHWCTSFLKGLPILNWLDEKDPYRQMTIVLPHRQSMSVLQQDLPELIESSDAYDERDIWYPLVQYGSAERDALIKKTPFKKPLYRRSQECHPCIHATHADASDMSLSDIQKVTQLEKKHQQHFFEIPFDQWVQRQKDTSLNKYENFYDGFATTCSWDYGCGL